MHRTHIYISDTFYYVFYDFINDILNNNIKFGALDKYLVYAFKVRMTKCFWIKLFNLGKRKFSTDICIMHHSVAK